MGVLGLWRLLDPMGTPVPVEILEGNALAIDVSIWIHQVLQGYQDRRGESMPNAHLLGLFNRICKLLYFKIKPVFVFDGGVPLLKKNTISSRKKQKAIAVGKAKKLKSDLLNNFMKRIVVKDELAKKNPESGSSTSKEFSELLAQSCTANEIYQLPEQPSVKTIQSDDFDFDYVSDHDSSDELSPRKQSKWMGNIHSVNVDNIEFKNLPADVRYDILTDLKETRKQNSWGHIHEMPQVLNDFSSFQMKRLLKRRLVQESMEVAEKEMGGKTLTLDELYKLLTEQGINTSEHDDRTYRIASDSTTRVIYVNDENPYQEEATSNTGRASGSDADSNSNDISICAQHISMNRTKARQEISVFENDNEYNLDDHGDSEAELVAPQPKYRKNMSGRNTMNTVTEYMMEYDSSPQKKILALMEQNKKNELKIIKGHNKLAYTLKEKSSKTKNKGKKRKNSLNKTSSDLSSSNRNFETYGNNNISSAQQNNEINVSDMDMPEKIEIIESNSNCNAIEISDSTTSTNKLKKLPGEVKFLEREEMGLEDSDSDSDFITVGDISNPDETRKNENETDKNDLQEDLFADLFSIDSVKNPTSSSIKESEYKNEGHLFDRSRKNSASRNLYFGNYGDINTSNSAERNQEEVKSNEIKELEINIDESSVEVSEKISPKDSNKNIKLNSSFLDLQSSSRASNSTSLPITKDDLLSMEDKLEDEQKELRLNIGKLERQAMDMTEQMQLEAQELLRIFGIPYVVAPMEAEAQCAYLEQINLTDGTITDDSDIWLFGGKCVYKNFFNNNKRVLQFKSCDIQHHFKLSRQQMIQLALLVGSDYTFGLPGIGPVTAMEILAAFPAEDDDLLRGLINFSKWIKSGKVLGSGKTSLRNKLKNLRIGKGFPSQAVLQAYLNPTVDKSEKKFTWSKPNLILLADYVREKFGWTKLKFEEVINPVMNKLAESKSQKSIKAYCNVQIVPKSIEKDLSKRVQSAVRKLGCKIMGEIPDEEEKQYGSIKKKEKAVSKRNKLCISESSSKSENSENSVNDIEYLLKEEDIFVSPKETHLSDIGINSSRVNEEYIPQRENDRANAIKKKNRAIEVFNKSKKRRAYRGNKARKPARKVLNEAELSESSSSP